MFRVINLIGNRPLLNQCYQNHAIDFPKQTIKQYKNLSNNRA